MARHEKLDDSRGHAGKVCDDEQEHVEGDLRLGLYEIVLMRDAMAFLKVNRLGGNPETA